MSSGFALAGLAPLLFLPVIIAQWIGVLGLGKCGRDGPWWCMMIGTALGTLGILVNTALMIVMFTNVDSLSAIGGDPFWKVAPFMASSGISGLGSLLFFVGFAIHGVLASRLVQRVEELETIAAAQGAELDQHRTEHARRPL